MTIEPAASVGRERRLANLRATLARPGGPPVGPDQPPARAPFGGRRSPVLAARLAAALGADVAEIAGGFVVRRTVAPIELPLDRERLGDLPGHPPPDAPLVCIDTETTGLATAAGTLAFLVGLARWEGDAFCQTQLLLPDHADEPALLAEIAAWVTPDAWLVSYNGRGFDWPLIEARFRLAGRAAPEHAGHLDLLPFVRRVFRHRMDDARLRTVEGELLGVSRIGDVEGWEIPSIYLDVLRGGPVDALAGVVIHNEKDVRSLGLLLAHVERRYADRAARHDAPRGDLAGLARAYGRTRRHDDALACLDDALGVAAAGPRPVRPHAGRPGAGARADRGGARRVVGAGDPADVRRAAAAIRLARRAGQRPRRSARPVARAVGVGDRRDLGRGSRWTDERLAAERARVLRRLGRWTEAAEAWQTAAAAGGGLGRHRLDRGRQAPRAPPRGPGRGARGDAGGVAAAGAAAHDGPPAPAARGGPRQRRGAADRPRPASRGAGADGPGPATTGRTRRPPAAPSGAGRRRDRARRAARGPRRSATRAAAPTRRSASAPPSAAIEGRIDVRGEHAREERVAGADRVDEPVDRDRRPRPPPRLTAIVVGLERHAALRAVGQQHASRRGGGSRGARPRSSRPAKSSRPTPTRSARRTIGDGPGGRCVTRSPGTRTRSRPCQPRATLRVGRGHGGPRVRQLRRHRPEQPGARAEPRSAAAPPARPDPRPAGCAGCGRPASRC